MIVPIPYVHMGFGSLLALFSVPLILRRVPMNRLYGVRTAKAFASEANWYALNAYGGRLFLIFGLLLTVFGWALRDDAPPPTSPWAPVFLALPLLLLVPVLALIHRYGKGLPGGDGR